MIEAPALPNSEPPALAALWLAAFMTLACVSCGDGRTPAVPADGSRARLALYTSLPHERVASVAEAYRAATGVEVNYLLEPPDVLIDKMIRKQHIPAADVLLITGVGHLAQAVDGDVLRPVTSPELEKSIAPELHDPDGYWYALGVQVELIVYDARTVDPALLAGYAELADERWTGQLCLQRGAREPSRSLVASLIAARGERDTEIVVRGWRDNLAQSAFDVERELLLAIESGDCGVGIVGSDGVAGIMAAGLSEHLRVHFPPAEQGGAQLRPTAAGIARHSGDAPEATRFLEWLASRAGQAALHRDSFEYPSHPQVPPAEPVDGWPPYAPGKTGISRSGFYYQDAIRLIERARYR